MNHSATISVMMPCYNAREHLPWALGSLLAQTFEDWELVLVDDGSTDRPDQIVDLAHDPRIRLIRLVGNRGRGFARQVALDHARGQFLAMLDADDWMYPERLSMEVDVLQSEPAVAIVSAGMALTDAANQITGVRLKGSGRKKGPHGGLALPLAHAPSMFRREAIGQARFDHELRRSEDADFLRQLIQGRHSLTLPDVLYAYREAESISGRKAIEAKRYGRIMNQKYFRQYPIAVSTVVVRSYLKQGAYWGANLLNMNHLVTRNKQEVPSAAEVEVFHRAREVVGATVQRIFGPPVASGVVQPRSSAGSAVTTEPEPE